jgi:hypothetical protein
MIYSVIFLDRESLSCPGAKVLSPFGEYLREC